MKVYLSGSITSSKDYVKEFNAAAGKCKTLGHTAFNPLDVFAEDYHGHMKQDIAGLITCDAIMFVNDITTSKGVLVEKIVADACGIQELKL